MKNSFIMYYDYGEHFNLLSDNELGVLIRAIYEYEKSEVIPQLDGVLKMAFSFIKCQLDIDKAKYNTICERNSINGSKGGRPKTEINPKKPKKANGFSENPKKPKKADNEDVNDNVNENDFIKQGKPAKNKYGEFKNVLLSDDELTKLKNRFSDYQNRIEKLSGYIASKGTKYKSHYATLLQWASKENDDKIPKGYEGANLLW